MQGRGGGVKGWLWGNGSRTNTVMTLLHWRGGSPLKSWEIEYLVHSGQLCQNESTRLIFC